MAMTNAIPDEFDPDDETEVDEDAIHQYVYHQNLDADHISIEVERNSRGFNYTVKLSGDPSDEAIEKAVIKAKYAVELMEQELPKTT